MRSGGWLGPVGQAVSLILAFCLPSWASRAEEALSLCLAHEKVGVSVGERFSPLEREAAADHTLTLRGMVNGDLSSFGAAIAMVRAKPSPVGGLEGLTEPLEQAESSGATMLLAIRLDAREQPLASPYLRGDQYPLRTVRLLLEGWTVDVESGDVLSEFSVNRSFAANSADDAVAELTRNDFADPLARALRQACASRALRPAPTPASRPPATVTASASPARAAAPTEQIHTSLDLLPAPSLRSSERRVALVIGNDEYRHVRPLTRAVADARALRRELEARGFSAVYRENVDRHAFNDAVDEFVGRLSSDSIGILYYAGHGVQRDSVNYMLPVDLRSPREVVHDGIDIGGLLDRVARTHAKFTLAIIDACRDNPMPDDGSEPSGRGIANGRGLAPMTRATGLMVLYSAGSNQEAIDNLGRDDTNPNGLFMREFLQAIRIPGMPIQEVVSSVRLNVAAKARSNGKLQTPALYDESIGTFVLTPSTSSN